jgi:archaeal preflagellin peptidase FlaK
MGGTPRREFRERHVLLDFSQEVLSVQVVLLLGGYGYAAIADWREREVTDRLWQVLGSLGVVLGAILTAPGGWVPLVLWVIVGGLTLEHMFAWSLGPRLARYEDLVDLVAYLVVILVIVGAAIRLGIGSSTVPYSVIAVLVTVLFARGLFESGLLYGGADAKALMIAGVLVPLFPTPLLLPPSSGLSVAGIFPFSIDLLMDAALLSIGIPIALAIVNLSRGEMDGWKGFTGYTLPVRELPHRFVWVRNPMTREGRAEEDEIETSEQDRQRREKIARELSQQGIERIWVTPQVPYLVLIALGAVAALLAGNLATDLISLF